MIGQLVMFFFVFLLTVPAKRYDVTNTRIELQLRSTLLEPCDFGRRVELTPGS